MNLPVKIEDILKNKLQPQIEALGLTTEDEVNAYVSEYIQSAGDQFRESLQNQIDGVKSQFEGAVQKTITLSTSIASVPPIMANPVTISVANQTLQEIIGNTKSLIQEISMIMSNVVSLIGGIPEVMNTLQNQASEVQSEAQSQLVLVEVSHNEVVQEINPNDGMEYQCSSSQTSNTIDFVPQSPGNSIQFLGTVPFGRTYRTSYSENGVTKYKIRWLFDYSEVPSGDTEYQIEVTYQEEDSIDELGNPVYKDSNRTYSGKITK